MVPDQTLAEQFGATATAAAAGGGGGGSSSRGGSVRGSSIAAAAAAAAPAAAAPGMSNVLDALSREIPNPNRARSKWTAEEDRKVLELVEKYGRNWGSIAQDLRTGRTGKQVRERWKNQLRSGINRVRANMYMRRVFHKRKEEAKKANTCEYMCILF